METSAAHRFRPYLAFVPRASIELSRNPIFMNFKIFDLDAQTGLLPVFTADCRCCYCYCDIQSPIAVVVTAIIESYSTAEANVMEPSMSTILMDNENNAYISNYYVQAGQQSSFPRGDFPIECLLRGL